MKAEERSRVRNRNEQGRGSAPRAPPRDDDALLDRLQWETFEYLLKEVNPANGLIADKTRSDWPASIAATGLALAAYPIGVERGFMTRNDAAPITLTTLRFLRNSAQGTASAARCPARARRRHDRAVGGGRLVAVCAGDRAARDPLLHR